MRIDFLNSRQVKCCIEEVKEVLYDDIVSLSEKGKCDKTHFIYPIVFYPVLTIAQRVGSVAETIFKGLSNISAFPYTRRCQFFAGVNQLTFRLPLDIIALIFTPVEIVVGSIITTGAFIIPSQAIEYCRFRSEEHHHFAESYKNNNDAEFLKNIFKAEE